MATYDTGLDITIPSAGDLSSSQYHGIVVDSNGRGTIGVGAGTAFIGILQNKPAAQDRAMVVRIAGVSKVVGQDALNEGDLITANAQGFADATTTDGNFYFGQMITSTGGSAQVGECVVILGQRAS